MCITGVVVCVWDYNVSHCDVVVGVRISSACKVVLSFKIRSLHLPCQPLVYGNIKMK